MSKQIQVAKIYRRGEFFGYALAVDGEMLDQQTSTSISSEACAMPTITTKFILTEEQAENQIRIDI